MYDFAWLNIRLFFFFFGGCANKGAVSVLFVW